MGFVVAFSALSAVAVVAAAGAGQARVGGRPIALAAAVALGVFVLGQWAAWPDGVRGLLQGAALLCLCTWGGAALGHRVDHARYLWPLVLVAVGADVWSVTTPEGVTQQVVVQGQAPLLMDLLVLTLPVPGVGVTPVLGVGDLLFAGLLAGAVARHGLSMPRLAAGLGVGFALTLVALLAIQLPIPALPFLGTAGVAALGGAARPSARELALAIGVVAALFALRLFG